MRLKLDGTRWRTGGEVKEKPVNGVGSQHSHTNSEHGVSSVTNADAHASAASSHWTDAPADLNGLVLFGERRNLVSSRVPSYFKRSRTERNVWRRRLGGQDTTTNENKFGFESWFMLNTENEKKFGFESWFMLNMEATLCTETLVYTYNTTARYWEPEEYSFMGSVIVNFWKLIILNFFEVSFHVATRIHYT